MTLDDVMNGPKRHTVRCWVGLLATCFASTGCNGLLTSPLDPIFEAEIIDSALLDERVGARVWRLSSLHYHSEIQRLFPGAPSIRIPEGAPEHHLTDIAAKSRIDLANINAFADSAAAVASWALESGATALRCTNAGTRACGESLLAWLPEAAFRRPLTAAESQELQSLFDDLWDLYGYDKAVTGLIRAVLLSPDFLYRSELGSGTSGVTTLSGVEIANLMAFGITDQSPDAELLEAAPNLHNPDEREAQARRLMDQSAPMWRRFFWEWLAMATLDSQAVEVGLDETLTQQIYEEYQTFVSTILVDRRGSLRDLMTSTETWARPQLAELYGASHPGEGLAAVELDPERRAGLLTRAAWLVSHGKRGRDNVVRRGMGIYIDAMCFSIQPPGDIDLEAELDRLVGPDATVKEIVKARAADGTCGDCHSRADPAGLAFEHYGSTGAWQDTYEDGKPVESDVVIAGIGDFKDAVGLSATLVDDLRFQHCMVERLSHYLMGADVGYAQNHRWPNQAHAALVESDFNMEELLVAIVRDPAYVQRKW